MVTISYVVAAAMALVLFAALANLVVIQYASGVVRIALDEGVREGSAAGGGVARCQLRVEDVLTSGLGGTYGEQVDAECRSDGAFLIATATATFDGYAPFVPDLTFEFEAVSPFEGPSA